MSQGGDEPEDGDAPRAADAPRWAADDPTAMWDDGALRDKGYGGVADAPTAPSGPATGPDVGGHERANVVSQSGPSAPAHGAPRSPGLSWPITVVIATVVAIAAYLLVRFLR